VEFENKEMMNKKVPYNADSIKKPKVMCRIKKQIASERETDRGITIM